MVLVREAGPGEWQLVRDIRLTALRDAPSAFASAYQREAAFTEADWRGRLSSSSATFLAHLSARALYERCGFSPTGERQPLPSDPGLDEIGMRLPL
jgi:hypothetical protein